MNRATLHVRFGGPKEERDRSVVAGVPGRRRTCAGRLPRGALRRTAGRPLRAGRGLVCRGDRDRGTAAPPAPEPALAAHGPGSVRLGLGRCALLLVRGRASY